MSTLTIEMHIFCETAAILDPETKIIQNTHICYSDRHFESRNEDFGPKLLKICIFPKKAAILYPEIEILALFIVIRTKILIDTLVLIY